MVKATFPQIKICGLTRVEEAVGCVELGADAIGLVFFPKSPRHVTDDQARDISTAVSGSAKTVGVFVNASYDHLMRKIEDCRLSAIQLHGQESPELVRRLTLEGILVIKALFVNGAPTLPEAELYAASAFLVECSKGTLPGGNAMAWNWGSAQDFGSNHPLILAGGLAPDNISDAISSALPLAVDVSSGVESAPGRKNLNKVAAFVSAVSECRDRFPEKERIKFIF